MKKKITIVFAIMALVFSTSCSDDMETNGQQVRTNKVSVEKMPSCAKTRSATSAQDECKNLYAIRYKDMFFDNVPLKAEDVHVLKSARSVSAPIPVSVKGYSEWTVRTTGNKGGDWYKLAISDKNKTTKTYKITSGIYVVRDIWLWQTYTLPTPMVVVFNNNDYADYTKMGWHPETLKGPGFVWSLSGNKVTLKTAATLFKYTLDGAEILKTYPVNVKNLEWNFYYITVG